MTVLKTIVALLATAALGFGQFALAADNAPASDATLKKQVESKFNTDKAFKKISVDAKGGVITLKGDVKSHEEADKAVELAQSVKGVSDVQATHLTVEEKDNTHPIKDAYITAKVKGAFIRDKIFGDKPISVIDVHVETKEGIVYLSGTVESQEQAKNAEDLAKMVKDVKSVESTIKVEKED